MATSDATPGSRFPDDDGPGTDTRIEVELPARTDLAATLRVVVASLGADVGFTLDEIDDVRLAVNEVFASTADDTVHEETGARFAATFVPTDGRLAITMRMVGSAPMVLDQLATTILESVVHELLVDEHSVTIVKRAREAMS